MTPTVHFCTVVGGQHIDLLSRLIRHYKYLGVNGRWFVNVHLSDPSDPILELVGSITEEHNIEVSSKVVGRWRYGSNSQIIQMIRSLYPHDWCIIADLDEFQVYPDDLFDIIRFCEKMGFDSVPGYLLDRIGRDGELVKIQSLGSLWQQFPLGGFLSDVVLGGAEPKVVIAKGTVAVSWGNHRVFNGIGCPTHILDVPVHHFKWDSSIKRRLEQRCGLSDENRQPFVGEIRRFLEYLATHGRIDVGDPRLGVRYVGNPYGLENALE
jgi:hypothetical protein